MMVALVIVGTPNIERVRAFEAEHNPILIVHPYGVPPSQVAAERVQSGAGRHFQIFKPRYRVDLIEFATHVRPELTRNPTSRLAVDAIPDVPRGVIRQPPDHSLAL
jgi:hypothetical protein